MLITKPLICLPLSLCVCISPSLLRLLPSAPLHLFLPPSLPSSPSPAVVVSRSGHGTAGQRSASTGHTDPLPGNSNERSPCVRVSTCVHQCMWVPVGCSHVCVCVCVPVRVLIIKNKHVPPPVAEASA